MTTSRAIAGISIVFAAAMLTLAGTPHTLQAPAFTGDPSVPPASEVFRAADARTGAQGNVEDLAY